MITHDMICLKDWFILKNNCMKDNWEQNFFLKKNNASIKELPFNTEVFPATIQFTNDRKLNEWNK